MTFPMVWSGGTEWEHVYLDFKEFPNHYVDIRSSDLRDYLETLGTDEVTVVLQVTTWLGCVERLETARIGSRADWPRVWAGSGWVDHEHPSPWDDLNCRIPWR